MLANDIEKAFDAKRLCFIPNTLDDEQLLVQILDKSGLSTTPLYDSFRTKKGGNVIPPYGLSLEDQRRENEDHHWFETLTLFCMFMDDHGQVPRQRRSKSANTMERSLGKWYSRHVSIFGDDGFEDEMRKSFWNEASQFC